MVSPRSYPKLSSITGLFDVVVIVTDGSPLDPLAILAAPKGFDPSVPVYETAEPPVPTLAEKFTTTLFVPLVGFLRYQTDRPLVDVAIESETPAYVTLVTRDESTWTRSRVEVALTDLENVTDDAPEH